MSASPTTAAPTQSTKRPLEEPSSPSTPNDQPEAKRPALDKIVKEEGEAAVVDAELAGARDRVARVVDQGVGAGGEDAVSEVVGHCHVRRR